MKATLQLLVITLLSAAMVQPLRAQQANDPSSIRLNASLGISAPNGGRGWGHATLSRLDVELPAFRLLHFWGSVGRLDREGYVVCDQTMGNDCYQSGDAVLFQGGLGYRYGQEVPGRVLPFISLGATYEVGTVSANRWLPAFRAGLDALVTEAVALRAGIESEWQFPARLSTGVTFLLR